MKPLLKATRVTGEPVVLTHVRKGDEPPPADATELLNHAPPSELPPPAGQTYEDVLAEERAAAAAAIAEHERANRELQAAHEAYKQQMEDELAEMHERARHEGFERGLAEGHERAQSEHAAQRDAFAGVIAAARTALGERIDGKTDVAVEVVCEALAKILGQAMVEKHLVVAVVREVIRKIKDRTRLVVRVCPRDWALLDGHHDELTEGLSVGSVELVADDRVQLGGCLIETAAGDFDGRLEVQLERLREVLEQAAPAASESEAEVCT